MSIYFIAQGNPSKTIEYENYIKSVARDNANIFYENEPLKVIIKAFHPIPK